MSVYESDEPRKPVGYEATFMDAILDRPDEVSVALGLTGGPRVAGVWLKEQYEDDSRFNSWKCRPSIWYDSVLSYTDALRDYPRAVAQWEQWFFRGYNIRQDTNT